MFKPNMSNGFVAQVTATSKVYTGHEMLDEHGLIHMNGRVYDPNIGRFLSADILVQVPTPTHSQSYNRYSYVWNNPLSMVDPSGYATEGCHYEHSPGGETVYGGCDQGYLDHLQEEKNQSMSCTNGQHSNCSIISNTTPDACAPNCAFNDHQQALERMHNELFEQAQPSSNMSGRSTERTLVQNSQSGSCSGQMCRAAGNRSHDHVAGATNDFLNNYNDMRDANTIGADKYFHCKANCEASQRGPMGQLTAETISDTREWVDQNIKGDPFSASQADQEANIFGRQQGSSNPQSDCKVLCLPFRPNGLDQKY